MKDKTSMAIEFREQKMRLPLLLEMERWKLDITKRLPSQPHTCHQWQEHFTQCSIHWRLQFPVVQTFNCPAQIQTGGEQMSSFLQCSSVLATRTRICSRGEQNGPGQLGMPEINVLGEAAMTLFHEKAVVMIVWHRLAVLSASTPCTTRLQASNLVLTGCLEPILRPG